jgi:ribulose-5-phosphate 4-epimerase/fuculose-1-phosphate aldolase
VFSFPISNLRKEVCFFILFIYYLRGPVIFIPANFFLIDCNLTYSLRSVNFAIRKDSLIYISQTGSSLDELPGRIDRVPLDGSSTCELTSSSELWAHVKIYELTGDTAILHGHPRFPVILSMAGGPLQFGDTRTLGDVPVVTGEVGAGRHGLVHTLPQAMQAGHAAIVYGHGIFASSATSFHRAFERLSSIERMCFEKYKESLGVKP